MTGKNSTDIMERENPSSSKPLCKSVATNCASDLQNLLSSSPTSTASSSCCSDYTTGNTNPPSETDMFKSAAADEVRIFRNAKNRLESFKLYNWPLTNVETRDLAEAGFFLPKVRQEPDEVECIFCRVRVARWSPSVDPFTEHLKYSPRCDFMSGYIVQNIPLGGTPATDPIRGNNKRIPNLDVCGSSSTRVSDSTRTSSQSVPCAPLFPAPFSSNFASSSSSRSNDVNASSRPRESVSTQPPSDPSNSIISDQILVHRPPKYPNLVTTSTRHRTYPEDWCPKFCPISSLRLAEAGFFYSGPLESDHAGPVILQDVVTCFHCDRKVFNWSITDDPWQEHYRLNKDCYFIGLNYDPSRRNYGSSVTLTSASHSQPSTSSSPKDDITQSPLDDVSPLSQELNVIASQQSAVERSKNLDESKGSCKVCYSNEVEFAFLPCKHATCCGQCAASVKTCPVCRAVITSSIRIFL